MHYSGNKNKIYWQGKTEVVNGQNVLLIENDRGNFQNLMLGTGALVPDNWVQAEQRVKITIEKI